NESDEPAFTQPLMYKEIAAHPAVSKVYAQALEGEGIIPEGEADALRVAARARLDAALTEAKESRPKQPIRSFGGRWKGFRRAGSDWSADTRVPAETLRKIAEACAAFPPDFTPHPKLPRLFASRVEQATGEAGIDWGTAEML